MYRRKASSRGDQRLKKFDRRAKHQSRAKGRNYIYFGSHIIAKKKGEMEKKFATNHVAKIRFNGSGFYKLFTCQIILQLLGQADLKAMW